MEKGQQSETAKEAYREQLTKTNNSQTLHYSTSFPQLNDVSKKITHKIKSAFHPMLDNSKVY